MLNERIKKIAFSIIWQNCPLVKINMSLIQVRAIIAKINRRKILLARKLIGAKFPTLIPSKWGVSHFHTTKIAVRALHRQIFARINICDHQSWRTIIFAKKKTLDKPPQITNFWMAANFMKISREISEIGMKRAFWKNSKFLDSRKYLSTKSA